MKPTWMRLPVIAFAVAGLVGFFGYSQPAFAQEEAQEEEQPQAQRARATLEEVTVTGTRRETGLQTTALAITTVTPEDIAKRFATDLRGIADLAPNVVMEQVVGFNAAAFGIRGTGTNDIITTIDSAIGVLIDGFVLAHTQSQLLDTFDVESIQILRGPQGTLFGKNTTGGAVVVTTVKPVMNEFSGKVEGRYEKYNRAVGRFAVNVPLVEDKLAARLVSTYTYSDGQYNNTKEHFLYGKDGFPTPLGLPVDGSGEDLDGKDVFLGRAKLLFTPTDNYELYITADVLRDRSDTVPGINETPADGPDSLGIQRSFLFNAIGFPGISQTCPTNSGGKPTKECIFSTAVSFRDDGLDMEKGHRVKKWSVIADQTLTLDKMDLNLLLGYLKQSEKLPSTYTGEAFPSLFDATRNLEREQFQAEFRVTSNYEGPFNFVAGASYFVNNLDWRAISYVGFTSVPFMIDTDDDGFVDAPLDVSEAFMLPGPCDIANPDYDNGFNSEALGGLFVGGNGCVTINPSANNRTNFSPLTQNGDAYGVYFDASYDVTDKLTAIAGIRYSYEKKNFLKRFGADLTPEEVDIFDDTNGDKTLEMMLPDERFLAFIADESESWEGITFRAGLDYTIDENNFVYAMFSQGFKSGSFAETCASFSSCTTPFNREKVNQVELGYKADLLEKTLRMNLAAFYMKFNDVVRSQVVQIINRFGDPDQETQFRNVAGQENFGAEAEITWFATEGLRLHFTASYLDCKYTTFETDLDGDGVNDDASDLKVTFCPEWQLGAAATYDYYMANGGNLTFNADIHWEPSVETSVFNSDFTQLEERTLLNASITYVEPDGRYRVSVFGKNLLDDVYRTTGNSVAGLWNFTNYGLRRTYGVEVGFNF